MTLNAAFIQVFGDELTERGYIRIKGRHTYYARLVNNEIIHFITYMKEKTYTTVQNGIVLYAFDIVGGIETVYRPLIELGKTPDSQDVGPLGSMTNNFDIYMNSTVDPLPEENSQTRNFRYNAEFEDITLNAFKNALAASEKYLLPTLDKIRNINMCIDFYHDYISSLLFLYSEPEYIFTDKQSSNESLLYFLTNDYAEIINGNFRKSVEKEKERMELNLPGCKKREMFDKYCEDTVSYCNNITEQLDIIYKNKPLYEKILSELNRRKQANIARAADYGLL